MKTHRVEGASILNTSAQPMCLYTDVATFIEHVKSEMDRLGVDYLEVKECQPHISQTLSISSTTPQTTQLAR